MIRDWIKRVLRKEEEDELKAMYPLSAYITRAIADDYAGPIVTSDIDRTYLQTSISSVRGLVRTALENAEDKRAFAGMISYYQGMRAGPDPQAPRQTPLYFVSASPPQMEEVLQQKMQLDGIDVDGLIFKDQLRLVRSGRVRELRKHIIYKLTALLYNRLARPQGAQLQEILIGDDSETDAEAYMLYTRIVQGAISPKGLEYTLDGLRVRGGEKDTLMKLASHRDSTQVVRIYIHCTTHKKPHNMLLQDPLLLAAKDSLHMGLDSYLRGWLHQRALLAIAQEMGTAAMAESLEDARQRQLFEPEFLDEQEIFLKTESPSWNPD